jgi:anti-sigma regulatory factor (Ser/Thr protein kinase)
VYRALAATASLEDDIALLAIESLPLGPTLELTLEATPEVLAPLRRALGRWLAGQGFSEKDRFGVTLAVSEAAGNAIEHAYGAREAKFTVSCRREAAAVQVCVSDTGSWRESRPYGRGRGLSVMRAFTDRVEIERGSGGTTVTLIRNLPADAR